MPVSTPNPATPLEKVISKAGQGFEHDGLALCVIPAKAGIQAGHGLDAGFRRHDEGVPGGCRLPPA